MKLINKYAVEIVAGVACVILFVFGVYVFNAFWHMAHAIAIIGIGMLAWHAKKSNWAKEKRIQSLLTALLGFYTLVYAVTAIDSAEVADIAVKGVLTSFIFALIIGAINIYDAYPTSKGWIGRGLALVVTALMVTLIAICWMLLLGIVPNATAVQWLIGGEIIAGGIFFLLALSSTKNKEEKKN